MTKTTDTFKMNLVILGKRILGIGPKGTPPQRVINCNDPKNDFDVVNFRTLKLYGGGGPDFSLSVQVIASESEGLPFMINGGGYFDSNGDGVAEYFPRVAEVTEEEAGLCVIIIDRYSCNDPIVVTLTGDVSDVAFGTPTQVTIPAGQSMAVFPIGFVNEGTHNVTFTAVGCGLSRSTGQEFNNRVDGTGSGGSGDKNAAPIGGTFLK